MRTSNYTIYVKLKNSGEYLLFHGYTGAVDLVNSKTVKCLRSGQYQELQTETVSSLKKRGYITEMSGAEEQERVKQLDILFQRRAMQVHSFIFLISYDCNFRCNYCYEQNVSSNGNQWSRKTFSEKVVDAAYTAIDLLASSHDKLRRIYLYGGEPLLFKNYDIIQYIVSQGIRRGYTFFAITNGYELDKFKSLIGERAINHLQVTLDGYGGTHNRRRTHYLGLNTFNKIVDNISLALQLGVKISLRINLDKKNISDIDALLKLFLREGWNLNSNFSCYVSPLQDSTQGVVQQKHPVRYESCDHNNVFIPYSYLRKAEIFQYIGSKQAENQDYSIFTGPDNNLKSQIKEVIKTKKGFNLHSSFCGANNSNCIFDPYGDMYTCLEVVGITSERIGKFFPNYVLEENQNAQWRNRTVSNLLRCRKCKYAFYCGGGCTVFAKRILGDFQKSYCDEFPRIFQLSAVSSFHEFLYESISARTESTLPVDLQRG